MDNGICCNSGAERKLAPITVGTMTEGYKWPLGAKMPKI